MRIVDGTDPAHPTEAGFFDTPGYVRGLAVRANFVYAADGDAGLYVLRPMLHTVSLRLTLRNTQ